MQNQGRKLRLIERLLILDAHFCLWPNSFVLNACRVAAYLLEGRIFSKEEGGVWALNVVPETFKNLILMALEVYRSGEERAFDAEALEQFGAYMEDWLRPLVPAAS